MSPLNQRPIVILPCDMKVFNGQLFQSLKTVYVDAVRYGALCLPLAIPVGDTELLEDYLSLADGVIFPGSPANVHPSHFDQTVHNTDLPLDPDRDATTLPMLRAVIERGIPLLAICRGIQELNVALGGSLHQAVQEVPGFNDHREKGDTLEQMFALRHPISLKVGGMLHELFNQTDIVVNSLHGQGIDRLAVGLRVEATANDGVIEAVSMPSAKGFVLGVQFHPEWNIRHNPTGQTIFKAFGAACQQYAAARKATPTLFV